MPGMAVLGLPEHVHLGHRFPEHLEHGRSPQLVAAVGSPGSDDPVGASRLIEQVAVVVFTDRIRGPVERLGIGRP
jgi:hypothetical protein